MEYDKVKGIDWEWQAMDGAMTNGRKSATPLPGYCLHQHANIPLATATDLQIIRVSFFRVEMGISQNNHLVEDLLPAVIGGAFLADLTWTTGFTNRIKF